MPMRRRIYSFSFQLELSGDSVGPTESKILFDVRLGRGIALTEADRPQDALLSLRSAIQTAPNVRSVADATSWIRYIEWDDENLATRRTFDTLLSDSTMNLDQFENEFSELRKRVHARNAVDEVDWHLALIESNQKHFNQAAERLWALVERTPKEVGTGMPADSSYLRYFEDFGRLTQSLANDAKSLPEKISYLERAGSVPWSGRAFAQVTLALHLVFSDKRRFLLLMDAGLEHIHDCRLKRQAYQQLLNYYIQQKNRKKMDFYSKRRADAC